MAHALLGSWPAGEAVIGSISPFRGIAVRKLVGTVMVLTLSCIAAEASAKTVSLAVLSTGTATFSDRHVHSGAFTDSFRFRPSSLSNVIIGFTSSTNILSLQGILQEKTHGGWTQVGSGSITTTSSFTDLSAGRYRFETLGIVPSHFGRYAGDITVAAVPEADTWMMLLIGGGMVAYQLRRKQKSLPRQPIAPPG